ncbi:SE-domain-containing protein [Suhomyces tanzawaensis NRRL Y-17324]|uniref:Translation initiation factor eIF2B subunit epsilon n=1 Tax=Suhomyces tanzawaensis NRRL Y-17324 TaxID=984487 RepID=A0A1E4SN86_9ASCO|nr:SE-domain-containing protein [Suhomyces tanzawaensis NRRL Y-17324]ODV80981.1 SE-domain-containing protein [Suhomyces tanzawaensis NRRL Y-17324]
MPPKNKKQKEVVQDERFQAVVLTDSFETRFMPLTSSTPRCLLPLANVPLIEYTLEFLAKAGVNEVYLMCSSHADQIQQYVEKSKWVSKNSPFKITTIMSLESRSVGDVMRDIDNRGLISGDFLLVSGDVVTNIDFNKAMNVHKYKKQQDKDHIVTMVLTQASPLHKTRSQVEPGTFILDKKTDRCLYYSRIPSIDGRKTSLNIDPELLEDIEDEFVIRNDLIDCCVDICSPHVPQIFQENFDYQTLRSDFVKGVLTSDLLKKTIYAYISDNSSEYAARVESFATYDAISQDILARWCYPLVPDSNLLENSSYTYEFNHIYKEDKVILAQSCKIGSRTSIGSNTSVGDGSSIQKSVIGKNCQIGKNVTISNSYIWDNAIIGDNTVINHAIVASGAQIGSNDVLSPGVVVGFNVKIGNNKVLANNTRVVESPIVKEFESFDDSADEDDDSETNIESAEKPDSNVVGEDGVGFVYTSDLEEDSDDDDGTNQYSGIIYQLKSLNVSDESIASVTTQKVKKQQRKNRRSSVISTDFEAFSEEEEEDFAKEAYATVERALNNNHDLDTALLELNTLRMSMNVTYHEVRLATTDALVNKIIDFITTDTLDAKNAATKIFNHWGPMYKRQVFNDEEQVDLLNIFQDKVATADKSFNQVILFLAVRILYELDILEEENILKWWSDSEREDPDYVHVRGLTQQFITWLEDAEEESEESDEERLILIPEIMTTSSIYDVIVVGAGVVGPSIATALARQGRKVLIVERDWSKPDRIVGELLQPAGIKALKELGMAQAINNIEAIEVLGYYISFHNQNIKLDYPLKADANTTNAVKPVADCVHGDNDKIVSDSTINTDAWDEDERVRGIAFHHGEFLGNLRRIVRDEPNVDWIEGTVTKILRDEFEPNNVIGVKVKQDDQVRSYHAKLTISCDGIYSKFRKEISPKNVPVVGSYFVGLELKNAELPAKNRGNVILGDHAPILIYQISPEHTRILCAYRSTKPPSQSNGELMDYMTNEVLPALPKETQPSFKNALKGGKFRVMPNQFLSAMKQGRRENQGLILLGDSLNMRHPLTGGGMTVGLNDAVLLAKLLHPKQVADLDDYHSISRQMGQFHRRRKNLDAVVNTLSIALYTLFAADKTSLKILQSGCFRYLSLGGSFLSGPIGLLSGMLPFPMLLFNHFFSVAFYAIYCNFGARGFVLFPLALYEAFETFFTAVIIFTPYLWNELVS